MLKFGGRTISFMPYDTTYAEAGTHPEFLHPRIRGASPHQLRTRNRPTRLSLQLRSAAWNDSEPAPSLNAVRFEIVMIDRQNQAERFTLGNSDKGGIGEIHRTISILMHEGIEKRQVVIAHGGNGQGAGADKLPCRAHSRVLSPTR